MKNLPTQVLLTCAAIGAAGALLTVPVLNVFGNQLAVAALPLLYVSLLGLWVLPAALAQALLNLPGVAFLTMLFAAIVSIPFTPWGPWILVSTPMMGMALEVPWLISGLQWLKTKGPMRLSTVVLYVWMALVSAFYGYAIFTGLGTPISPGLFLLAIVLTVISHLVGLFLGRLLAKRLRAAGLGSFERQTPATARSTDLGK